MKRDWMMRKLGRTVTTVIASSIVGVLGFMWGFHLLYPYFGVGAKALIMGLVIVAAIRGGVRGGLIAAALGPFLGIGTSWMYGLSPPLDPIAIPFIAATLVVGYLAGRMSDLGKILKRELAERERVEALLRQSEESYRLLFEGNPHPMWVSDAQSLRFLAVNEAAIRHYGHSAEEFVHLSVPDLLLPLDVPAFMESVPAPRPAYNLTGVRKHRKKDGTIIDVDITTSLVPFQGREALLVLCSDVTERIRAQESLEYQAMHDALTGLPNRTLLKMHIEQNIALCGRDGAHFSLLVIDLDRFKEINDTLGHPCGDVVLQQLGPRFRKVLRACDVMARLGGDEFAILLPETGEQGASAVIQKLLQTLHVPFVLEGQCFEVGASIGIASFPEHAQDASSLLRLADVAMYAAKRGGSGFAVYSASRNQYTPRRLALVGELRQGIENNQLMLHYQPKLDLKTLDVRGAEALVRWQHPREGLMAPNMFIPLAEQTGLIKPLSLWVLNTALLQCRVWRQAGMNIGVAVNLAPGSLQDLQLPDIVSRIIENSDSLPSWLTLELTESSVMADPARAATILTRLHEMGIRISIDDFGTGHSSLAYIKNLPVDEVKIDRTFIKELSTDHSAAAIVESVINMSHSMQLEVVAEGVEDQETLDLLRTLGCDLAQGFHFSRPVAPSEFTTWLSRAAHGPVLV
ncbi:MAG TPA: EAL domain-containing protein [Isosphaeraceae bacterium]|nr:EAL domain-containing protein [Isosphaeraceae bacterium]